ncbi:hypothetical protein HDU86_008070 [Geranomyces michiganensis]|nr:hypothetical protein HDU86_008070 [Geranomyces michiganensis]
MVAASQTRSSMTADRFLAPKPKQYRSALGSMLEAHHVGPDHAAAAPAAPLPTEVSAPAATKARVSPAASRPDVSPRATAAGSVTSSQNALPTRNGETTIRPAPSSASPLRRLMTPGSAKSISRPDSAVALTRSRTGSSSSTSTFALARGAASVSSVVSASASAAGGRAAVRKRGGTSSALPSSAVAGALPPSSAGPGIRLERKTKTAKGVAPPVPLTPADKGLLAACEGQDLETVYATLWTEHPDINCRRDHFGSTPLAVACRSGNAQVAALLLSYGADVNASDAYGVSPLHWAATSGSAPLVSMILSRAISKGHLRPVLASLPLASAPQSPPPPLPQKGDQQQQPLTSQSPSAAAAFPPPQAHPLSQTKSPPNVLATRDAFGSTALHFASVLNAADVARVLIQAGIDPTARNNDGRTAADLTTDAALRDFLRERESRLRAHVTAYTRMRKRQEAAAANAADAANGGGRSAARPGSSVVKRRAR